MADPTTSPGNVSPGVSDDLEKADLDTVYAKLETSARRDVKAVGGLRQVFEPLGSQQARVRRYLP